MKDMNLKLSNICLLRSRSDGEVLGFTLIELLVSVGVTVLLGVLALGAFNATMGKMKMLREVNAAKTLITAYQSYASDRDGKFMTGVDKLAGGATSVEPVWFEPWNRYITWMEAPHRYPFRLAPYFGYRLNGVILLNGNAEKIEKGMNAKIGLNAMADYGVSVWPALGLNYNCIGGQRDSSGGISGGNGNDIQEVITRQSQIEKSVLVFASADNPLGTESGGFHMIVPPTGCLNGEPWTPTKWQEGSSPGSYGALSPRYGGRAVCAFSSGEVSMKTVEELRDMRVWSRVAARNDDRDYVMK